MAITKREQAEVAALRERAAMATALGWPQFPKPKPLPRSNGYDEVVAGWTQNWYARRVERVWQTRTITYTNPERKNGSRSTPPVYATEAEAALAWAKGDAGRERVCESAREV